MHPDFVRAPATYSVRQTTTAPRTDVLFVPSPPKPPQYRRLNLDDEAQVQVDEIVESLRAPYGGDGRARGRRAVCSELHCFLLPAFGVSAFEVPATKRDHTRRRADS